MWWWTISIATVVVTLATLGYVWYRRESRRVQVKLQNSDDAKEELLDDYRGRAVRRIQQMNQLRKSPSKFKIVLKQYIDKQTEYRKVLAASRAAKGDGLRSLYKQPDELHAAHEQPLVRVKGESDDPDAPDALPFGLRRQPTDEAEAALLRLRAVAFKTLKRNFDFLDAEQLAALSFDASEVRIKRGDVLVTEGTKVATPSLYIVESGLLECTCDGGKLGGWAAGCWLVWHRRMLPAALSL